MTYRIKLKRKGWTHWVCGLYLDPTETWVEENADRYVLDEAILVARRYEDQGYRVQLRFD